MNQTDLVVTARLESKESFDNQIWRYSLLVKENHYGLLETGTPAYLYGKADLLEDNQDYLMFLQADTLPLYPHLLLALTHEELLIPGNITSDIILGSTHLASSIDDLTTMLSKQEGNKNHISYDPLVARNVSDVVNNSDYLALKREEGNLILAASGMTVMPTDSQEVKELLSIISP